MLITYIIHFIVAFFATVAFSILFSVPKTQYLFCGITGASSWVFYYGLNAKMNSVIVPIFVASTIVTFLSRIFAVYKETPVTIFLIPGIFPLVPGTGIYYTSYYFIMNEYRIAGLKGIETLKISIAIALGIMCIFSLPHQIFRVMVKKKRIQNNLE